MMVNDLLLSSDPHITTDISKIFAKKNQTVNENPKESKYLLIMKIDKQK